MGNVLTVSVWLKDSDSNQYQYYCLYSGENWIKALYHLWKGKKTGSGCIKLEYRPRTK